MMKTQVKIPTPNQHCTIKNVAIFGSADVDPQHPLYQETFNIARYLAYQDKVVVDGVAKVKEGQEVSAKPYQPQAKAPQGQNATPQATEQKQVNSPKAEQKATSQA